VVTEPNPARGTFTTNYNYTYTPANQLTTVSMTRGNSLLQLTSLVAPGLLNMMGILVEIDR
jgi:hypothetical protein